MNAATKGCMHQHRGNQDDIGEALHGRKHPGFLGQCLIVYRIAGGRSIQNTRVSNRIPNKNQGLTVLLSVNGSPKNTMAFTILRVFFIVAAPARECGQTQAADLGRRPLESVTSNSRAILLSV